MLKAYEGIGVPAEVLEYLSHYPEKDHFDILTDIVYREVPVSMEQFVLDDAYLGLNRSIFPNLVPLLTYLDQFSLQEIYMLIGRGGGKSTVSAILMARGTYRLMCYRDARAFLGSIPNKEIVCLNVSVSETQAKKGVFTTLTAILQNSPWFSGRYDAQTLRISFDGGFEVLCGHSKATTWLGMDIFVGVLDEANFLVDRSDRSNADELWDAIQDSGQTRFPHHYKIISISSSLEDKDFMTRKIEPIKEARASRIVIPGLEHLLSYRKRSA